ncbi:MAG: alanine racemase [Nitrospinota bacterium]|nr:alanine racemase [Nitrospinota bacterium]
MDDYMENNNLTTVEIDLDAFSANLAEIRRFVGAGVEVMPVVKADAYGHGGLEISKRCLKDGIGTLVVSSLSEAAILRESGIEAKIVVLFGPLAGEEECFIRHRLTPVLYTLGAIKRLGKAARVLKEPISIHIIVDTGMGRIGFLPETIRDVLNLLPKYPEIEFEGIMTHFSSAYTEDRTFTEGQIKLFKDILSTIRDRGLSTPFVHVANSAGIINYHESFFNGVRPGIMLYGARPSEEEIRPDLRIEPVMTFKTQIVQVRPVKAGMPIGYSRTFITKRDSIIGTIPVGYANGYSRAISNRAEVLVRGHRVPQIGTVCMDITMIDLTDLPEATIGDEVVLFGRQGGGFISVDEVAEWGNTIPYEILCQVGKNIDKRYIKR